MVYPHTFRTEHSETKTTNSCYGQYYATVNKKKISIQPPLQKILQYVDSNRNLILNTLEEMVKIPSISGDLEYINEVNRMIKFTESWLIDLGVKYECFNIGFHELNGKKYRLPTIILGTIGNDPGKKTVCVYAWLDVKKPDISKWKTNPWAVTDVNERLFGCGTAAGKGTLIAWFYAIKAFQDSKLDLPVNIKLCIESMFYQDNAGLEAFLGLRKQDFFFNVQCVVICNSEWIGEKYPCLTYGSVGLLHFEVTIEKLKESKTDPKDNMIKIFEKISDDRGSILIPKFNDLVQQITPDEERMYEAIRDFDVDEIKGLLPEYKKKWDKVKLLMHFWRLPSIIVDDIKECICEKQDKTMIKRHFIIKIVQRQIVETSTQLTIQHINNVCNELNIDNKVDVELLSASRPWIEDIRSPTYEAARKATIQIYKEDPNMIREDGDMKVVTILNRVLDKNLLVLPTGNCLINSGGDNENISKKHFYESIKLMGAYLFQISYIND